MPNGPDPVTVGFMPAPAPDNAFATRTPDNNLADSAIVDHVEADELASNELAPNTEAGRFLPVDDELNQLRPNLPSAGSLADAVVDIDGRLVAEGELSGFCSCDSYACMQDLAEAQLGCGFCLSVLCGNGAAHVCTQTCDNEITGAPAPQMPFDGQFTIH